MTIIKGFDRRRSSSSTQQEHLKKESDNRNLSVLQEHNNYTTDAVLNTMKEQFDQQQSINNKLLEMLDYYKDALQASEEIRRTEQEHMNKQFKELEERLADRISQQIDNRDKEMMKYIRSSQQQQQEQLLETAATQQKGFFARLLGK
ncbi:hypothetical protein ACFW1J_28250 [Priestia aryabhattai]|uniref:hypothetical protein n=1 Tax=Priestia aryabhattai TaxID=412384 RepID=UPI0035665D1A